MRDNDTLEDPLAPDNYGPLERAVLSPIDGRRIVVRYESTPVASPSEDATYGIQASIFVILLAGLGVAGLIFSLRHRLGSLSGIALVPIVLSGVPLLMILSWSDGLGRLRRGIRNARGAHTIEGLIVAKAQREFSVTGDGDNLGYVTTVGYIAVDDGTRQVITAWQVSPQIYRKMAVGKRLHAEVSADGGYPLAIRILGK